MAFCIFIISTSQFMLTSPLEQCCNCSVTNRLYAVVSLRCWLNASHASCTAQPRRHASHNRDNRTCEKTVKLQFDDWLLKLPSNDLSGKNIQNEAIPNYLGSRVPASLTIASSLHAPIPLFALPWPQFHTQVSSTDPPRPTMCRQWTLLRTTTLWMHATRTLTRKGLQQPTGEPNSYSCNLVSKCQCS